MVLNRLVVMNKVNLQEKLALINDHWNPRIAGELNNQQVKLVKFKGPFTWHHHEEEDELFMVINGRFKMEYRDEAGAEKGLWIEPGEMVIVPRRTEHRPVAEEECHVLLFEPATTLNTGNQDNEFTRRELSSV